MSASSNIIRSVLNNKINKIKEIDKAIDIYVEMNDKKILILNEASVKIKEFQKNLNIIEQLREMKIDYIADDKVDQKLIKLFNNEEILIRKSLIRELFKYIKNKNTQEKRKIAKRPQVSAPPKIDRYQQALEELNERTYLSKRTRTVYERKDTIDTALDHIKRIEKLFADNNIKSDEAFPIIDEHRDIISSTGKVWRQYIKELIYFVEKKAVSAGKDSKTLPPDTTIYKSTKTLKAYSLKK